MIEDNKINIEECEAYGNGENMKDKNGKPTDKFLSQFETVDDFFGRAIKSEFTFNDNDINQWIKANGDQFGWTSDQIISSPAECYLSIFTDTKSAKQHFIKGEKYTNMELLGYQEKDQCSASDSLRCKEFNAYKEDHIRPTLYENTCTMIYRLSPKHYHCFHCPVDGEIRAIDFIGGKHLSVQPAQVKNKNLNVYTENTRYIIYIDTVNFGTIAMVIIGATCVSSAIFEDKKLQEAFSSIENDSENSNIRSTLTLTVLNESIKIKRRDKLGRFRWGGSTIVLLIPKSKTNNSFSIIERFKDASSKDVETEIRTGQIIGYSK